MSHPARALSLLLATCAAAAAQTPPEVLALTDTRFARIDDACNTPACPSPLAPTTVPWAGGVAHDPRDRCTWISNGPMMAKIDPRDACSVVCPPFAAPDLVPGEVVTGLAFNESTARLFVSHSDNRILTYAASGCSLTLLSACTATVPTNHVISGLATDDVGSRLYYASSPWLGSGPPPQVLRTLQSSPCTPTCAPFAVPTCNGPVLRITGLGFDPCRRVLHVTDGRFLIHVMVSGCTPTFLDCCMPAALGEPLLGLCRLPSTEVSTGNVCFTGSVTPCPPMQHVLVGDPTIGNFGFGLALLGAPAGTFALLNYNIGGCLPATTYSFLCTGVPLNNLGWAFTGGTTGCTGSAALPLPIPPITALCGLQLSTRWWGISGSFANNYVSNCLTWAISGS